MATTSYFTRIGACKIQSPIRISTALPDLSSLVFTASALAYDAHERNDVNPKLDTTASYYVMLAPLGEDLTNGGLTYSAGSPVSGPITVSSTQGIRINIAAANLPANLIKAYAMGVFLKKNTSDFAIVDHFIIDRDGNDFNCMVTYEPLPSTTRYPQSVLQTGTANASYEDLGSRDPVGCDFSSAYRTSGGVEIERVVAQVNVTPDNSVDYNQVTSRGTRIRFNVLANTVKNLVKGNAGFYARWTIGTKIVEQSTMSLQTAVSSITGNVPIKVTFPPNEFGVSDTKYYLASVLENQTGGTEQWKKDTTTTIPFVIDTVNIDPLLDGTHSELSYNIRNA